LVRVTVKKVLDIGCWRKGRSERLVLGFNTTKRMLQKILLVGDCRIFARLSKNPLAPHKIAPILSFPIVIDSSYVILLP